MFRKLLSVFGKATNFDKIALAVYIRKNFNEEMYKLYNDFSKGKIKDSFSSEYTKGVVIDKIAQIMHTIHLFIKDEREEIRFWKTLVLPHIESAMKRLDDGEETNDSIIIKSMDFSASLINLLELAPDGKLPAIFLTRFILIQNSLFPNGGYFSNTPFWRLFRAYNWRHIDSSDETIYYLWFMLLVSDFEAYNYTDNIAISIIELYSLLDKNSIDRLYSHEVALAIYFISLGSKYFSLNRIFVDGGDSKKITTFLNLSRQLYGEEYEQSTKYIVQAGVLNSFNALQELLPVDNILNTIPSDEFSVKTAIGAFLSTLIISSSELSKDFLDVKIPKNFRLYFSHFSALKI